MRASVLEMDNVGFEFRCVTDCTYLLCLKGKTSAQFKCYLY